METVRGASDIHKRDHRPLSRGASAITPLDTEHTVVIARQPLPSDADNSTGTPKYQPFVVEQGIGHILRFTPGFHHLIGLRKCRVRQYLPASSVMIMCS